MPDPQTHILVADHDRLLRRALAELLRDQGYAVTAVADGKAALERLRQGPVQLVIADLAAAGDDFLRELRRRHEATFCVVLTAYGSIGGAVEAVRAGAFDYLVKPVIDDELLHVVRKALRQQALVHDNRRLQEQLDDALGRGQIKGIVGQDQRMQRLFETVARVADTPTTLLVRGESGTGKSKLARAVHTLSSRHDRPFVEVACGALPDNLLEAELFGHVKGAFTGADRDREGRLAAAQGGTLFLDEINSAPLAMQVKLLRVLQDRVYEPLGTNAPRTCDVRFVLASNADLAELVAAGSFREDLFYRINVVTLDLPPLRERQGDVPLLASHFLERFRRTLGRDLDGFTPDATEALVRYGWPGNIRELENAIERAAVLCRSITIGLDDLPEPVRQTIDKIGAGLDLSADLQSVSELPLKDALEALERPILLAALERNDWSRQKTAAALGINRATLFKKMRRYRLDVPAGA